MLAIRGITMARILFVEDEPHLQELLLVSVMDLYEAEVVSSAEEALALLSKSNTQFDIAVVDVGLPKMSGLDLIPHLLNISPSLVIISVSATNRVDLAVEAMKRGAKDFLLKPFDLDKFLNVLTLAAIYSQNKKATKSKEKEVVSCQIMGQSPPMQEILQQIRTVAPFNSTILITGETGTGKELVAQTLHLQSTRAKQPFVAINCAAIPEQLLEDELFGHIKGAFTGAQNAREGRFEQANGGTLFLDEIADMNLALQAKLLRVLQERKFEKLGSAKTIDVDVRIVAATSANLEERIQQGAFRPDLYYRLNIINIHLPPVRERKEDILNLAEYFLVRFCGNNALPTKTLAADAQEALVCYNWPGNVRQLQNAMERVAILTCENTVIRFKDLPKEVKDSFEFAAKVSPQPVLNSYTNNKPQLSKPINKSELLLPEEGLNFDSVVTEIERELLCQSLRKTRGNKMQAAKLLNMKRTTFVEKLKRLGVSDDLIESEDFFTSKSA